MKANRLSTTRCTALTPHELSTANAFQQKCNVGYALNNPAKSDSLALSATNRFASCSFWRWFCALAGLCLNCQFRSPAADLFVQVTNPGWTNSSQYSWTGAWGDYDGDGFVDLFVPNTTASWASWTNFLYHNNGNGTFTRMNAAQVGPIASDKIAGNGAYWGDVNNDGHLDLLVLSALATASSPPVPHHLYLNHGDGTFQSINAGDLSQKFYGGWWGGLADYDNDGFLDAFLCAAWADSGHRTNLLFHGHGDGTFSLVTNTAVATDKIGNVTGASVNDAIWGDFDNDGDMDLLVANLSGSRDFFYRNDGHGQFTRLTNSILEKYSSWHHAWGDFDNDGFLDLAAAGAGGVRLFHNTGGDFLVATNWTFAADSPVWGDYDNDGFLDLLILHGQGSAAKLRLYHNNGDGTFTQTQDAFTGISAQWLGGGWADYDNDGFLDLFLAEDTGKNALFHNLGNTNHWIKFQLEGVVANRSAIGAKVRVQATIGGKTFWQMREVSGGNFCQNDLRPNFGLGDATKVEVVRIEWPSGNVQELSNVSANQILTVKEVVLITPTNPSASLNGSVTLTRWALFDARYQWRFDGVDLPGQTNRTLALSNLVASQQGRYSVVTVAADVTKTNHVFVRLDAQFTKITDGPLVSDLGNAGNLAWGDYDGDGYPDLAVGRWKVGTSAIYHNSGDGTFTRSPAPPFLKLADGITPWADIDNDGRLDLFAWRPTEGTTLYFTDAQGNGIPFPFGRGSDTWWSLSMVDYNRDGLLDLFFTYFGGSTNRLYRNEGNRSFTRMTTADVGALVGVNSFGGASFADFDDDGWPDLYAAHLNGNRSFMFRNDGAGHFIPITNLVTRTTGPALSGAWGDYDNDGLLDLCVVRFNGTTTVYHNLGDGQFERATSTLNLIGPHNSASWGDYDNDGFLDLFVSGYMSGNKLFHNNGDGTFTRVTQGSVVNDRPIGGAGSYQGMWFDYDRDGFLDLYVGNGDDNASIPTANFLYHNNPNDNHWLEVRLVGTSSNPQGIGAKIRAQAKYAGQSRWQRRDITSGDFYNGNNLIAHFGLGNATNMTTLRIEWPSGTIQEMHNVKPNQFLTVTEPRRPALTALLGDDGALLIRVTTESDHRYRLESSTDLRNWEQVITFIGTSSVTEFVDPETRNGMRFYRVVAEE